MRSWTTSLSAPKSQFSGSLPPLWGSDTQPWGFPSGFQWLKFVVAYTETHLLLSPWAVNTDFQLGPLLPRVKDKISLLPLELMMSIWLSSGQQDVSRSVVCKKGWSQHFSEVSLSLFALFPLSSRWQPEVWWPELQQPFWSLRRACR